MKAEVASATPVRNGHLWPLSIEAYHVLGEAGLIPEKSELLYGLVYAKMSKSPIHAVLIARLLRALARAGSEKLWVRSEQPITCGDSEPEPDISVVAGTEEDYLLAHPSTAELAIEVSVTSHDYDRSKLQAYATAGVKEYWLVLAPEKQVEIHSQPSNGAYLEMKVGGLGGEMASQVLPEFRVNLDRLFRS